MASMLSIEGLTVDLMTAQGILYVLEEVGLELRKGEILGLVGESGCGKSITSKAVLRLLDPKRSRVRGRVVLDGVDLLSLPQKQMPHIRGKDISMIFQEPMTSLSPLKTIGEQLEGAIRNHSRELNARQRRQKALLLLDRVGITPVEKRFKQYPFELSGGLQQRAMIAQAIACDPKVLIADEPTTALDVTIQAQILRLLKELQRESGMSVLLITHNFGVVAQICDRVAVMYGGRVVETAAVKELLTNPLHPYTRALIACIPQGRKRAQRLQALAGSPPLLYQRPQGCVFASRCDQCVALCTDTLPQPCGSEHSVLCHHDFGNAQWKEGI